MAEPKSSFTPQQIADFHRAREIRAGLARRLAALAEIWRVCDQDDCRRHKACRHEERRCGFEALRASMTDEERPYHQFAVGLMARGVPYDEAYAEADRRRAAMSDPI